MCIIDQPILRERWVGVNGKKTTLNGQEVCPQLFHGMSYLLFLWFFHQFHFTFLLCFFMASGCPLPTALRCYQRGTLPRPGTRCHRSTTPCRHVCWVLWCCRSLGLGVLVATMFMQARFGLRNANRGGEDHASTYVPKLIDLPLGIALFAAV